MILVHLNQLISKFVLSFWLAALKKKPEATFDKGPLGLDLRCLLYTSDAADE